MASSDAVTPTTGRDVLDAPPRKPRLRNSPRPVDARSTSKLRALSGGLGADDDDGDDTLINSPDGQMSEMDGMEATELDTHPIVQAFDHFGQALSHLEIMDTLMGGNVMLVVSDLITLLKQLVPQQAAAMLSGNALGLGPTSGAGMLGAYAGTPPQAGLGALSGIAAGGMGAGSQQAPPGGMVM